MTLSKICGDFDRNAGMEKSNGKDEIVYKEKCFKKYLFCPSETALTLNYKRYNDNYNESSLFDCLCLKQEN